MIQSPNTRFVPDSRASRVIRTHATPYSGEMHELDVLMDLIDNASFVLIGEASHGTHEFYKTRIDLTRRLITERGFNVIAAEADWPDCWAVNRYVKGKSGATKAIDSLSEFKRFPTWLWRNADVLSFVEWLKKHNEHISNYDRKVGFYGLDLYSLYRSADAVIAYLDKHDPPGAQQARDRYACLSVYGHNEQNYGYAASLGLTHKCEEQVIAELIYIKSQEVQYLKNDGRAASDEYFFAEQNARVVARAQEYYREMFTDSASSWNLRDRHMMETLLELREHFDQHGEKMKVVVWAHNSHLGDARATQMSVRGELNLGQLVRQNFYGRCCSIGFTTNIGTVTAASRWGGQAERKNVRPAMNGSYEHLFSTVDLPAFILPLKAPELVALLNHQRLERAIGVLYLPETELTSHYFGARLPEQFDAIIHFQETQAVEPLERTAKWISGEERVEETID